MNRILIEILMLFSGIVFMTVEANNCTLPKSCFIQRIKYNSNEFTNEKSIMKENIYAVK